MLVPGSTAGSMLFRLVDYDGMWVPALAELPPNEVGHPNYQHPQRLRSGGYSAEIDRFAHLAIYTALRCLMVGGKLLWPPSTTSENVLFERLTSSRRSRSGKLFPAAGPRHSECQGPWPATRSLASQGPLEKVPLVSLVRQPCATTAEQWDQVRGLVQPAATRQGTDGLKETEPPTAEPTNAELPTATELPTVSEPTVPSSFAPVAPMGIPLEQRRAAAELYARANDVIAQNTDYVYAQQLLLSSCKLNNRHLLMRDPTNIDHRRLLREVGRAVTSGKRAGLLGSLTNLPARGRL